MHLPAEAKHPNEAQDHFPRQRDVECSLTASLGLWDVERSPPKIDVFGPGLLQRSGPRPTQQCEKMEFAPDWIIQIGQLEKPSFQIAGAHTSIPALLLIPIDSICGIVTRQRSICLPSMILNGPQRPHAAIRHVGTVLLGKLIMLFGDASAIIRA